MFTQDYTAKLLDLEDVMIKNVERTPDKIFIQIELPRKTHICPACGSRTDRVHDYRKQLIKDVPLGRDTFLILRKRRYICACGKRFPEKNSFLPRYYRVTGRLVWAVIQSFGKVLSAKEIGSRFNISGMTAIEKLTEEEMNRLALMFEIAPRLADAYRLKNEFLKVMRSESSAKGRERLKDWLLSVELMEMEEFRDCVRAYRNWFQEILNSMDVPWTNGYIEGCNNKTKVLKRTCYGMRNFNNFRKRILFCNT